MGMNKEAGDKDLIGPQRCRMGEQFNQPQSETIDIEQKWLLITILPS
jgi:hypothetical protein